MRSIRCSLKKTPLSTTVRRWLIAHLVKPFDQHALMVHIGEAHGADHGGHSVSVIADADRKIVGIGISLPSLSKALRKSRGRLLPFGWWPLLKALKMNNSDVVDLLLVAVKPEYQNKE